MPPVWATFTDRSALPAGAGAAGELRMVARVPGPLHPKSRAATGVAIHTFRMRILISS